MKYEDVGEMLFQASRYYSKVENEVKALLDTLTPRENAYIRHFYGMGREHIGSAVIAERFNLTEERIGQIERRAFRKIAMARPRAEHVDTLLMALVRASNPGLFDTEEGRQQMVKAALIARAKRRLDS